MTATIGRDRELKWLPLDKIVPNERNPRGRRDFKREELTDLERSIKEHGILEPLIVQRYEGGSGLYLLLEGERRWTVAKGLGLKEVPTSIVRTLEGDDQVVLMYNLHENRKGWEMASHLKAIQELLESSPHPDEDELARQLGLSLATFRDRLRVLGLGGTVVSQIAKGELDYTSALRSAQAATAITKKRPELAKKLGGEEKIAKRLLDKAKARGGLSHELTAGKADLTDTKHVPDEAIEEYLTNKQIGLREVTRRTAAVDQKRKVSDLSKSILRIQEDLEGFADMDLTQAPNLMQLRQALRALLQIGGALEDRISEAIIQAQVATQDREPAKPPRRKGVRRNEKSPAEAMQAAEDKAARKRAKELAAEAVDKADAVKAAAQ